MLIGAFVSAVLGNRLPRRRSRPTRIGDTLTVWAEVSGIRQDKPVITLQVGCKIQR